MYRIIFTVQNQKKRVLSLLSLLAYVAAVGQLSEHTVDAEGMPNEPTVAIANDSTLLAAANVDRFYTITQKYNSVYSDYDLSISKQQATSPYGVYGDPVLRYAGDTLFFAHLAKASGKEYGKWFDKIVLQKVVNTEKWTESSYSVGYNDEKMQDKPWLCAMQNGDMLVTWTEFDTYGSDDPKDRSRIRFAKYDSRDNKVTKAITISDTTGDCLDGDNTLEGATTAVGRSGRLYAVWSGYNEIYLDYSDDGGATWNKDKVIAKQVGGWDMAMPNVMRANGMPFIVCDTLRNRLFVTWADERDSSADIWMKYSDNEGDTWSSAIRLNLDQTSTHQYFPNIALDPNTGKVYVAYYDFKSSPSNTFYAISLAEMDTLGGIVNYQLTPYVSALPGTEVFFGDYLDISIKNSQLAVIYTVYDISQKTHVKLVQEHSLQDGIFYRVAISNTLAIRKNKVQTELVLNIEHPYKLKIKLDWVDKNSGKKIKYRCRLKDKSVKRGIDEVLGVLDLEKEDELLLLKYTFKDLETKNKYSRIVRYLTD